MKHLALFAGLATCVLTVLNGCGGDTAVDSYSYTVTPHGESDVGGESSALAALEGKLDLDAQAAGTLADFEVLRSRFSFSEGSFRSQGVIELTVRNSTDRKVSRVQFVASLRTPGRDKAWVEAPLDYSIPGGMKAGESDTWRINSDSSGGWNRVPRDRYDMVLTVEVVRLEGPNGRPMLGERFTAVDARATLEAIESADSTDGGRVAAKLEGWEQLRAVRFAEEQRKQVAQEIEELERAEAELAVFELKSVEYVKPTKGVFKRKLKLSVRNGTPETVLQAHYAVRVHSPGRKAAWSEGEALFRFDRGGLRPGQVGSDSTYADFLLSVPFDERDDIEFDLTLLKLQNPNEETIAKRSEDSDVRLEALRKIVRLI